MSAQTHDPLRPHAHDPNPTPPTPTPDFIFTGPAGTNSTVTVSYLQQLPETKVPNCYIVSTGHGTSGPFTFVGVTLLDLIQSLIPSDQTWSEIEVISADGFGNRVVAAELAQPDPAGPILLSYKVDDQLMSRAAGLVRMIVPNEKDDALRQVKWVGQINLR